MDPISPADPKKHHHLNDIRGPRTTKMKILLQLYLTTWMVQEMWEVGRDSERKMLKVFMRCIFALRWFPPPRNIIETGEKGFDPVDMVNILLFPGLYIPGGAGFLPSTV